ncbi:MAG: hypothetical protein H7Y88_06285, partial [Phycisphaerales bacterium]|nr:hypothetical protein [Phycisphaerales bacterium]
GAERAGLAIASPAVNADAPANRLLISAPSALMPIAIRLVESLDQPTSRGAVEVRVFALTKSSAESVAAAIRAGLAAGAMPGEPTPIVTAEPGSNSVVIAASPERIRQAEALVASLDGAASPEGVSVRTIALKHARAATVAPLLESLLTRESVLDQLPSWQKLEFFRSQKDSQQGAAAIRVAAENRLNAIVVTGPVALLEVAEQIVSQLDVQSGGAASISAVRVISLNNADASELAASITAVFADDPSGGQPPTVRVDKASNSLIVRASDEQLATITDLASKLDAATLTTSRDLRMISVDRSKADAGVMAQAIQRLLEQRGGVKVEIISTEDLLKRQVPAPAPPDNRGGFVAPNAAPTQLAASTRALAPLIATLAMGSFDPDPVTPSTEPDTAPPAVQPASNPPEPPVTIAVDPATNSLVVVGSARMTQRITALAAQLERQMLAEPTRLRIVMLPESADARAVAQIVMSSVRQMGTRSAAPDDLAVGGGNPAGFTSRVSVEADPAGGALIVSANDTDFAVVSELIAAMARPAPSTSLTVKVYPLTNVTADRALRAVADLIRPDPRGQQSRRVRSLDMTFPGAEPTRAVIDPGTIRVTADPSGSSLIVAAPVDALALLDNFISLIDQSPVADRAAIRRFTLTSAKASAIAPTLQQVFDAARQGAAPGGMQETRASFVPDERTNTILVAASQPQLRQAEELLKQLDVPLADDGTEVAIIPLQVARPAAVKQVVQTVLAGRDPAIMDKLQITASDDSQLFVIRATPEHIAEARRVIEEMDKAEVAAGLEPRSIKLERADAESVARALQQFFDDRARAASRPGQRQRQRQVAIVGDRRTSTLIVAASDEEFEQVKSLVSTFDAPSKSRDLQFKVIPLQHARATEIQQTLESVVGELNFPAGMWWSPRVNQQEQDKLVVQVDSRSNSVVVMGNGESFGTVESIVSALDQPRAEKAAIAIRAVHLKNADPRTVASAIAAAMSTPDWPRWRGADPDGVRAEVDARTRSLLLIGRAERLDQAAQYIAQLDVAAEAPDQSIESIPLKFARADQIAQSLTRFFQDKHRALTGGDNQPPQVAVMGSRDGNVLVVSAPPAEMATVKQLLAQMDQPDEGAGRERQIFNLRNADAAELARTLQDQFPRSLSQREGLVIVTPQPSTNSVIVSAPTELFDKVEALVTQLDAPPSAEDTRMVTVTLSSARAEDVATSLSRALPKTVKVTVTPVRRSNSLLLTGSDEAIKIVMEQIGKLDEQPARSPVEFRRFMLTNADVYDVASTVRSMLTRRPADPGDAVATVSTSSRDNTLLISATADQLAEVAAVLKELDVPSLAKRTTEFVPLKFADASATADALDVFYGRYAPEAATPGARNVTIIANPASKSLVVSADEAEWPGIRALLEKLDNETYDTSKRLEIVQLKHADAVSLASTLTEAFAAPLRAEIDRQRARAREQQGSGGGRNNRDGEPIFEVPPVLMGGEETVTVVAERLTNSLVISAPRDKADRIKGVIAQLDVPEFARLPEARIIPLRIGPATAIAQSLRQMFTDQSRAGSQGAGLRSVLISGEDKSNVLIVRADEAQFAQIKALAETLQQEGDRSRAAVHVLRLSNVPAGRVAATLRTTFAPIAQSEGETIAIEIDRTSNALVVAASQRLFEQIERTVRELDTIPGAKPGPGDETAVPGLGQSVFIIDVANNSPEQIARILEAMGLTRAQPQDRPGVVAEPITVSVMTSRRAIAVVATASDGQAVTSLVRSLDAAPAFPDQEVAIVRLRAAPAQAVATALDTLLKSRATDAASSPAAALVEQVRRLSVHRNGADQPSLLLDLTKPIRIQPEAQTNSLLIASTKENVAGLKDLVELLDKLPLGDAVTVRFFTLQNASATRIASVVRELFTQGDRLRLTPGTNLRAEPTTEVGKALIGQVAVTVDERTNAIIVAGREEAVALVEVLITQLDSDRAASWVEPRIIPLRHADASKLARTIQQVLVQGIKDSPEASAMQRQVARIRVAIQAEQEGGDGVPLPAQPQPLGSIEADLFTPLSTLIVLPEEHLNALIVLGSPANAAAINELVKLLDVPAASADNTVRLFPLKYAAADRVSGILTNIFRQQAATSVIRPEDDLIVSADLRTNTLIISTSLRSFGVVEKLLTQLDGQNIDPTVSMHVISVPGGNPATLAPKIERLVRDRIESARRAGDVASPSDTFSVQAEPATGSLIVVASDENLQMVKDVLDALSRGAGALAASEMIDIIGLTTARAEELLPAIRELYADKQNALRGTDAVWVTADSRLNAIIVRGTADDAEAVRELAKRLESQPITVVTEIKRIELNRQEASEVVRVVQNILAGRPLAGARAGSRQATLLRFLRDEIAGEVEGEPSEAEISGAIQEQVTLTADNRTNSVVVVAPARIMALIEQLINDLDTTVAGARTIEIFRLTNADARAMAEVLRELFNLRQQGNTLVLVPGGDGATTPEGGAASSDSVADNLFAVPDERQQLAITIDARTNSLLVSATPEYLEEVRKVVNQLDGVEANEREQIVYELRNTKALEVAATMRDYFQDEAATLRQTLGADRAGSLLRLLEREVTVHGDELSNRLIVGVSPRYRESIDTIVKELDSTPPQVMIQVLLAEVTLDVGSQWGLDFRVGPFGGEDYNTSFLGAGAGIATALGVPNFAVSSLDFELLVRALEVQGRLEVLSRPQILVKNNKVARIQVGEDVAIVTGVQRLDNGDTRSDVERKEVGIILNVTPSISNDGFVSMDIQPEISSVSARTTEISEDFQAPIIDTRKVDTNVTVRDGETIVIGGLIQTRDEQRNTKVPLLSAIPIIGEAFKSRDYSSVKTELLVILTPHVIRGDSPGAREALRKLSEDEINRLSASDIIHKQLPPGSGIRPPPPDPLNQERLGVGHAEPSPVPRAGELEAASIAPA